jgi:hypothetical protein
MNLLSPIEEQLKKLEESLRKEATRFNRAYMDSILSEDFIEFGRSWRTYSRQDIIESPTSKIDITFPFKDFRVRQIQGTIFLVHYISEVQYETLEKSNRTSLRKKENDTFLLLFHQWTPIIPSWI